MKYVSGITFLKKKCRCQALRFHWSKHQGCWFLQSYLQIWNKRNKKQKKCLAILKEIGRHGPDWLVCLLAIISFASFNSDNDRLAWHWESSEKFSTQSLYKFLNHIGILTFHPLIGWTLPVLPKIRIFMQYTKKILTKYILTSKRWIEN